MTVPSAFAKYEFQAWPHRYQGTLVATSIHGGIPSDPKVAEGWIKSKLGDKDDLLRAQVAETMVERGIPAEEAAAEVDMLRHVNGFKRDDNGLYVEGRQLKSCIREAACVAAAVGKLPATKWGNSNKHVKGFVAEHICVVEDRLYLGVSEPSGVLQRFVHAWRGAAIQYEEYVDDAKIDFTIMSDYLFPEEQWAMLWLTAQEQGLGASRSQGYGRFTVVAWDEVGAPSRRRKS